MCKTVEKRHKMKTVFLLNPKAGKGKGLDRIKEEVDLSLIHI